VSQKSDNTPPEASADAGQAGADEDLLALLAERDELKDRLLRVMAETDNFKKRTERDKADFLRRANESLVKDLLPVVDNLERALAHLGENEAGGTLAQGVELTLQELMKTLERHGLERVEAVGLAFNPEVHEAMMQQEDADAEDNTVLGELGRGYLFQGRLLRPAMVVVSKRPAPGDDDGAEIQIKVS
jgi:molecular chaperone GrpE